MIMLSLKPCERSLMTHFTLSLACLIHFYFEVGWVKADSKAIQSIHDSVITFNPRVKVSGDLQTTFSLHIEDVTEDDRGQYMCQINTVPMIYQAKEQLKCSKTFTGIKEQSILECYHY